MQAEPQGRARKSSKQLTVGEDVLAFNVVREHGMKPVRRRSHLARAVVVRRGRRRASVRRQLLHRACRLIVYKRTRDREGRAAWPVAQQPMRLCAGL